eukprot:1097246-Amphidinium_carterae.1
MTQLSVYIAVKRTIDLRAAAQIEGRFVLYASVESVLVRCGNALSTLQRWRGRQIELTDWVAWLLYPGAISKCAMRPGTCAHAVAEAVGLHVEPFQGWSKKAYQGYNFFVHQTYQDYIQKVASQHSTGGWTYCGQTTFHRGCACGGQKQGGNHVLES